MPAPKTYPVAHKDVRFDWYDKMDQRYKDQKLADLESIFAPLLLTCLAQCGNGRWGLFGQNDSAKAAKYLYWEDAQNLRGIALQIHALRAEFGQPNLHVERFLHYCSLHGPNVPGEPKLAKAFLDEIQKALFGPV